jgi:hypothetical protein
MTLYFKRFWDETTGDTITDDWETSTYYFETDEIGDVLQQLEVFANDKRLKYTPENMQDEYGGLSKVFLDLYEFEASSVIYWASVPGWTL